MQFETKNEEDAINPKTREIEVLEQLSKGLNYNQIADNLIFSPSTVRKHVKHLQQIAGSQQIGSNSKG